ncbi:acetyl-CoA carboxylase carboxyl transferase subunit beta [Candidatus Poribacteria bacterium]|nr:acetyl-CoA carboxylase carboxyl transferase subunit beta [Candidatus Poribacteria bacterium]MBT5535611.1 acetyl-CoA carboxylase carboxyl transferase subunit beta [Candidatus Poribacteria bacterium]MBT7095854.1 acetyl-CoA carboxylase carboxyl transferase subunit beta [Candidatus Poribacteria bacterium]MBT7805443.1 acetyl-CoA carboxylase carboxyl transferase subunit beta [Candidatus Poribacteria bacterium]
MTESVTCQKCDAEIPAERFLDSDKVCPECGFHYPLTAHERRDLLIDDGTFDEFADDLYSVDFLEFPRYAERLETYRARTGLPSEMVTGTGAIGGCDVVLGVTDMHFIMGSMGSVLGEKIARCFEVGIERGLPVVIVSGSGAGARMDEGTVALMQMAKTSAAARKHADAGLLYISVVTNPTMGGTAASFVTLGHVIIAEPGAMIGFAGPRARAAIGEKMPPELQSAEALMANGMLDMVVPRAEMRATLLDLLYFVANKPPTTAL